METKQNIQAEMAIKITSAIGDVFDKENINYIEINNDNLTDFIYALIGLMPVNVYNKITGNDEDILSVNHIANKLIVQNIIESNK